MGKAGSRSVRFGECGMPRPRRVCNVAVGSCHLSIHVARSQWFAVSQSLEVLIHGVVMTDFLCALS